MPVYVCQCGHRGSRHGGDLGGLAYKTFDRSEGEVGGRGRILHPSISETSSKHSRPRDWRQGSLRKSEGKSEGSAYWS